MKELEPSEIFKNIIIQVFWIAICVLLFKSHLFTELNLIPSTCKPRTQFYSTQFLILLPEITWSTYFCYC